MAFASAIRSGCAKGEGGGCGFMTSDGPVDRPIISTAHSQAISIAVAHMQICKFPPHFLSQTNTDRAHIESNSKVRH